MTNNKNLALLIGGCLLQLFAICTAAMDTGSLRSLQATSARPNVLVIVADDMGYADLNIGNAPDRAATPRLNELARSGTRFSRFYTDSTCSPSRAALLTGRYPARMNFLPNGLAIPTDLATLPKTFRAAGYRTHQIGKWHLGHLVQLARPDAQGFDSWLGNLSPWQMTGAALPGSSAYGDLSHLDVYMQNEKDDIQQFPGHLTDVSTDAAIRFIKDRKDGQPWLMYLAYLAPHEPIQPRADYAARFPDTPAGRYSALLAHLDARIGDVLYALDATGQRNNTIVVFASDNGGTNAQLDNNTPFQGKKTQYREGSIRTPLLISWPGKIASGRVATETSAIIDIYPTLATLARLPVPADVDGRTLFTAAGAPVRTPAPRSLFWEIRNDLDRSFSVLSKDGRWRLTEQWLRNTMLFDLQADPGSDTNVAAAHPDIVRQLQSDYDAWRSNAARIDLTFTQSDAQGHGVLTGDDVQRAVTFGGFSIAMGVTPASDVRQGSQVILEQKPTLKIARDDSGLSVQLHDLAMRLPPLPAGRCSSVVVTGTFNRRIDINTLRPSTLHVYIDGKKVGAVQQSTPLLNPDNLGAPTYVGSAENGSQRFDGTLSTPVYLNTRADSMVPAAVGVPALTKQVCERSSS